ncbi:MAG: response regulator transcription factor [Anaerolineales bacterium]|nr:response regulator transcription factor [Anaerolineales bacterium]
MGKKILLIDDDPDLGRLVGLILQHMDITVYQSYSGLDGLKQSYEIHPDLVILDIMMPVMNGFDVCLRLREISNVPVLMLTARAEESDILRAFNVGADDYVKKPFNKNEFEARVYALLRRSNQLNARAASSYIQSYEDPILKIDISSQTITLKGEFVECSPREYSVLACLVREQGKIVSKRELVREVWGEPVSNGLSNPSLYVYYLRKKLQDGCYGHQYIHTLWGRGYWFEPRKEE